MTRSLRRVYLGWALCGLIGLGPGGCRSPEPKRDVTNPYPHPWNLAVAPFEDLSGRTALGPEGALAVTDAFYTELQQIAGLQVVPVNRVLATLENMRLGAVGSPDEAMRLADALGVDDVIIGAITRYDPYQPPLMGMVVQLYARDPGANLAGKHVDPARLSRAGQPYELELDPALKARGMVIKIVDAGKPDVIKRIQDYARRRGDASPLGWEKYLSQSYFPAFVAHEVIADLIAQETLRLQSAPKKGD